MSQHTRLCGNLVSPHQFIHDSQQGRDGIDAVGRGIDADDSVTASVEQSVNDRGRNALRTVGRMIGLKADGQSSWQTDGRAKSSDHAAFLRAENQVLVAHQLGNGRRHFRHKAGRQGGQHGRVRLITKQPFAELSDREAGNRRESCGIMRVNNQPRDFVRFIRNQRFLQKLPQGRVSQAKLRRHPFLGRGRRHAGQFIAGTPWSGFGHHLNQGLEAVRSSGDSGPPASHLIVVVRCSHRQLKVTSALEQSKARGRARLERRIGKGGRG